MTSSRVLSGKISASALSNQASISSSPSTQSIESLPHCKSNLGGPHGVVEICGYCHAVALRSVRDLRRQNEALSTKMDSYGKALRYRVEQLELEVERLHGVIRSMKGLKP